MISNSGEIEILPPKKQLNLFGYENYFNSFTKLSLKNKLPNTILLMSCHTFSSYINSTDTVLKSKIIGNK